MTTKNPPRLPFTPLYDQIIQQGLVVEAGAAEVDLAHVVSSLPSMPRFLVDDAAQWLEDEGYGIASTDDNDRLVFVRDNVAPAMPPFNDMWIEHRSNADLGPGEERLVIGMFVSKDSADAHRDGRVHDDAVHALVCKPVGTFRGRAHFMGFSSIVFLDEQGWPIQHASETAPGYDPMEEEAARAMGLHAAAVIGMMHCKNVRTVEHERPAPKASKKQRRPRKAGLSYSTIHLPGHTYDENGFITSNGSGRTGTAAHAVRGHFATYTDEAPRFGRPDGVGTFWINPHVRGNRDKGEVRSTYVVGPLDEQDEAS